MIVMKFGGSSISTTERIQSVLEIIRSNSDRSPVIVPWRRRPVRVMSLERSWHALRLHERRRRSPFARDANHVSGLLLPASGFRLAEQPKEHALLLVRFLGVDRIVLEIDQ